LAEGAHLSASGRGVDTTAVDASLLNIARVLANSTMFVIIEEICFATVFNVSITMAVTNVAFRDTTGRIKVRIG
jgi:prophage tail gpP-like protein